MSWLRRSPVYVTIGPPPRARPHATAAEEETAAAEEAASPVEAPPVCSSHYWHVRYEEATRGGDGAWRFPHRCRTCGLELLARDVADASAQAAQTAHGG